MPNLQKDFQRCPRGESAYLQFSPPTIPGDEDREAGEEIVYSETRRQPINISATQTSAAASNASECSTTPAPTEELPSMAPWEAIFSDLLDRPDDDDITAEFDAQVESVAQYLHQAAHQLKGPKHPNTRFYEARRIGRTRTNRPGFSRTSNPSRRDKRRRDAARERYQYDLAQYQYFNVRRQAVRTVLNSNKKSCRVPVPEVEAHFAATLERPNDLVRDHYPKDSSVQDEHSDVITVTEVREALKGLAVDTSPGLDKVLVRVVKTLKCEKLLSLIATLMYRRTHVPKAFHEGRTVLLPKDGDPKAMKNWRPITIFSVLRRIIERVLDRRLRSKVLFSTSQHGFVSVPGTHINSSIVDGVLRTAKKKKGSCVVVFLDITKAFDNIGHAHIKRTLESLPLPDKLRNIIMELCEENVTHVYAGPKCTRPMHIKRGVPQGAPLSPALFNLCIDFVLKELTDNIVSQEFGYTLVEGLTPVTALAFADDIVLLAKDEESARRLINIALRELQTIGLEINSSKSHAILLQQGQLQHLDTGLALPSGQTIPTLKPGEKIRYLGVDFEHEIVFDEVQTLRQLKSKLDLLNTTCLLHADQKLNVINNFIWPALVYPLQTAPLHKISKGFLSDVDMLIRGSVKQFCGLPMDTPNAMLYSSQKHRGLGVACASWEAFLQHINIVRKLQQSTDPYLPKCRDLHSEEAESLRKLGFQITNSEEEPHPDVINLPQEEEEERLPSVRELRTRLRNAQFSAWCALPSKGKGVELFSETPDCNQWVANRSGLSLSEWTNALKMSSNGCNLRNNPRNTSSTFRCRHCSEYESLGHVLGKCPRGELLRNSRHHRVCDVIARELRELGCTVLREDHQLTEDRGSRVSDLVVIDSRDDVKKGVVLDPTVRLERSIEQAAEVDAEKRAIYEPTLPAYRARFPEVTEWRVIGLLFGARGAIPRHTAETLMKTFRLPRSLLRELSLTILRDSIGILHHHLYPRDQH